MVVKLFICAAVVVGLTYLALVFPRVRSPPINETTDSLTIPAPTRMETLVSSFSTTSRSKDNQNWHSQTMALVPATQPAIRRRSLPSTRSHANHNSRFCPSGVGPPREARRCLLLAAALHHGRRITLWWNERSHGTVCILLETLEEAFA
jgi:hypothetical protein